VQYSFEYSFALASSRSETLVKPIGTEKPRFFDLLQQKSGGWREKRGLHPS